MSSTMGLLQFQFMSVLAVGAENTGAIATVNCTFQDCPDFCDGSCPYRPNISAVGPQNLTVYRLTPFNVTDLVDHNSGDAAGDLGFFLEKYISGSKCAPPFQTKKCFLDDRPVIAKFDVQFDAAYGPYLKCNPNFLGTNASNPFVNTSDWVCAYGYPGARAWANISQHQAFCPGVCQRVNVSVGKDPALHKFWTKKQDLLTYFGGYWYSTPKLGLCDADHHPGDGSGCTWEIRTTPVYINATCLAAKLFVQLEQSNPQCFQACGPVPTTDPCYVDCVNDAIAQNLVSKELMITTWEAAFDSVTGCPLLPLDNAGVVVHAQLHT
eukprot:m.96425 g.96425  ORF g.96425 m.96425 type:complete len:323 (+) comp26895_c0_seq1:207-1175(+)